MTEFGRLNPDGSYEHIRSIPQQKMLECPFCIMVPDHYDKNGNCKCRDKAEQKRMIEEWGYSENDFENL